MMSPRELVFYAEMHVLRIISEQLVLENTADPPACKQQRIINRIRLQRCCSAKANSEALTPH